MNEEIHRKVLVVDDDPTVIESTSLLLEKEGYAVVSCGNADEALAKITENDFDLVLSDIKMPRVSGIELLEKIHALRPELPVILMTAYADLDVAVKAISLGAFDFLIKPAPPDYLLHSLRKAFQHAAYLKLKNNYKLYLEDMVRQRTRELEDEISEHKRTEETLRRSQKHLRDIASRLREVEANERKELSHELHDSVGPNLTALSINLNIIQAQLPADLPARVGRRLIDSMALVEDTARKIRDVMDDLRPNVLDDYGLVSALRWYGNIFAKRTDVTVKVLGSEGPPRLPEEAESALFYISKEALNNIAKHAEAGEVTLAIDIKEGIARLTIKDDGKGFDVSSAQEKGAQQGRGLLIMQARAQSVGGTVRIESAPGKGTKIVVEVKI